MTPTDPMTVVAGLFDALNRGDRVLASAAYDSGAVIEGPWIEDELSLNGRRFDVTRVAGIETGWGWVRADWTLLGDVVAGQVPQSGYSYFWIEDGRIRRQRNVLTDRPLATAASGQSRHYPSRPIVGVGGVILDDDGRVVLVKRRHEPLAGQWSLPGGSLEVGETLKAGTAREMLEETGLVVDVGEAVEVFDRILVDETGGVRFHYVLIDYACRVLGGDLRAGGDVTDAIWAARDELVSYGVTEKVQDVVKKALSNFEL